MAELKLWTKNGYLCYTIGNRTISVLGPPVLDRYVSFKKLDAKTGALSLEARLLFRDGAVRIEEDRRNIYEDLWYGFKDPKKTVKSITSIRLE